MTAIALPKDIVEIAGGDEQLAGAALIYLRRTRPNVTGWKEKRMPKPFAHLRGSDRARAIAAAVETLRELGDVQIADDELALAMSMHPEKDGPVRMDWTPRAWSAMTGQGHAGAVKQARQMLSTMRARGMTVTVEQT
jgi:hypothetical protein